MPTDPETKQTSWWQPAMSIFARFSAWIIFPLLAGVFLGKWLENRIGFEPWTFLITVGISFIVSIAGLVAGVAKEYKRIEKEERDKNRKIG